MDNGDPLAAAKRRRLQDRVRDAVNAAPNEEHVFKSEAVPAADHVPSVGVAAEAVDDPEFTFMQFMDLGAEGRGDVVGNFGFDNPGDDNLDEAAEEIWFHCVEHETFVGPDVVNEPHGNEQRGLRRLRGKTPAAETGFPKNRLVTKEESVRLEATNQAKVRKNATVDNKARAKEARAFQLQPSWPVRKWWKRNLRYRQSSSLDLVSLKSTT